jgi:small-conductance mechanosensitive channel
MKPTRFLEFLRRLMVRASRARLSLAGCLSLTLVAVAFAAETPAVATKAQPPDSKIETAPVVIDGEVLFRLRGISTYTAKERAKAVAEAIRAIARDEAFPVSELRLDRGADRTRILAGERELLTVFEADVQAEGVKSRELLAPYFVRSIAAAIERYRQERSGAYLQHQALRGAIVLAVLAVVLLGVRWVFRRAQSAVLGRFESRLQALESRSFRLLSAEELKAAFQSALRATRFLIALVAFVACIGYVLSLFPWTRPFAKRTAELFTNALATMWAGIVDAIPGLVFIAMLIIVTRYALKLVRLFFLGIERGTIRPSGFDPDWAWPTYRLLRVGVIAFAVVIAYPYVPGSNSDAFKGVSIFLGLLMSIGAASMVANTLAGYVLIYRRTFKVGDRIQVGDAIGDVVEIRHQVTHVRTTKNELITIPSSTILGSEVTNYSSLAMEKGLILHTTLGIGYETPWRQVEAMLIEAAHRTAGLLREPPPFVLQQALRDFCVTYEINAYCNAPQAMVRLYTELHRNILDVFNEYGVQIMTPAYEGDPEQPKVVPREQWFTAPAKMPPTLSITGGQTV